MGEYGGLPVAIQDKICMQVPLLIKPATNLKGFPSFFHLSLPSKYGGQFWITPRKLPGLQTNNWQAGQGVEEMDFRKKAYVEEISSELLA